MLFYAAGICLTGSPFAGSPLAGSPGGNSSGAGSPGAGSPSIIAQLSSIGVFVNGVLDRVMATPDFHLLPLPAGSPLAVPRGVKRGLANVNDQVHHPQYQSCTPALLALPAVLPLSKSFRHTLLWDLLRLCKPGNTSFTLACINCHF